MVSSLALILLFFNIVIKTPIQKIISPLKEKKKPNYRGTVEFEFLSKNIEHMLESLHRATQELEQRVVERTMELKVAKEKISEHARGLEKQVAKRTYEITSILRYTPAVVYMKDIKGRYLLVNSRYEALFHVKNELVRGKFDNQILPGKAAGRFHINDQRVLSEKKPLSFEEGIDQDDGTHTYYSVKFPIFGESGEIFGMCGIASDITDTKKVHEQLRRLSGSMINSQEKERAAVARELHDELGQALTALHMDAYWLRERLKKEGFEGADRADAMCSLIDNTIRDVQSLAIRLRPGVLDDLGLVDALEWYTEEYSNRVRIPCVFKYEPLPEIDETLATAAYRITQEALTNVARHADATGAEVNLLVDDGYMDLKVSDNGKGFEVENISEFEELGLVGMRERASLVGGTLKLESAPGEGTEVCFRVKLFTNEGVTFEQRLSTRFDGGAGVTDSSPAGIDMGNPG